MQSRSGVQWTVVTGGAGFIGAYLARRLLKEGLPPSELLIVDFEPAYRERLCAEPFRKLNVRFMEAEAFDRDFASGALSVRSLFHMGACSNTDETREDYITRVNLDYSKSLWQSCVKFEVPFFYASSASTYGDGALGFSDDPAVAPKLHPLNLYGWSKQKFDLFALEESKLGRRPPYWGGFKFFNVYGPIEEHKGGQASVVWHARQQFLANGSVKLFRSHKAGVADGEQKRDFVWVGDVVDVLLAWEKGDKTSGIYNVGTGAARSFLDLARGTAAALGVEFKMEWIDTPERLREHYQYWTQAELSNLRTAGYTRPFVKLEDGIRQYFEVLKK